MGTLRATLRVWLIVLSIWLQRWTRRGEGVRVEVVARLQREVGGWPGVRVEPHRFGGIEFRLGRRELGHLHGDYLADLPFPVALRRQLVAEGRAMPHHILPASGWVSVPIRDEAAVVNVIGLFRLAYERALAQRERQERRTEP